MYLKIVFPSLLQQFWKCLKWLNPYVQVIGVWWWVFGSRSALQSHQRCSAVIRTWFYADQSSSSTLTESIIFFWTLPYTQRHCHVRIEKGPVQNCCYNIRSTQFPRISLYALTLRFVLIEITKVVNLFIRRGRPKSFGNIVYISAVKIITLMQAINVSV